MCQIVQINKRVSLLVTHILKNIHDRSWNQFRIIFYHSSAYGLDTCHITSELSQSLRDAAAKTMDLQDDQSLEKMCS